MCINYEGEGTKVNRGLSGKFFLYVQSNHKQDFHCFDPISPWKSTFSFRVLIELYLEGDGLILISHKLYETFVMVGPSNSIMVAGCI